ncbi:unnamed protein product [Leuciscus chuanchicus]
MRKGRCLRLLFKCLRSKIGLNSHPSCELGSTLNKIPPDGPGGLLALSHPFPVASGPREIEQELDEGPEPLWAEPWTITDDGERFPYPWGGDDELPQGEQVVYETVPACVGVDLPDEWAFDVRVVHNSHCAQSAGTETPLHELCAQELPGRLDQKHDQVPVVVDEDCYGKPLEV